MSHSADAEPSRLLVVRLSALGDVIHTIPAVIALKLALPRTEFAWVVERPYAELVERVAAVRAIPVSIKRWGRRPLQSRADAGAALSSLRAFASGNTSVDFQGLVKSAALGAASGASNRFGFDSVAIREKAALVFINRPRGVDTSRHVVDQNMMLAAGVVGSVPSAPVDFGPFVAEVTPELLALRERIVLLPGAGKANKQWPAASFAEVARHFGDRALAVWGPGEESLARAIGCDVAPPTSLRELAFVLRHARLVIGGDTGPLHLAAALGTPLVGLFGPTNPRRNGPYGQLDHCVSRYDGDRRIESVAARDVIALADEIVGRERRVNQT